MPDYYFTHDNKIKQNKYKQERVVKKLTALNSENVRNPVLPVFSFTMPATLEAIRMIQSSVKALFFLSLIL
jgi:hypothetical protein